MKTEEVKYGKIERETVMDQNGSTLTESGTMHDGNETDTKTRFEIRIKVKNEKDVLTEFMKWRAETASMTKTEFRIEHTAIGNKEGFFYVVKCWQEMGRR